MINLPNDYSRCMGINPECLQRKHCARHQSIPENTVLSWVKNLNPDNSKECSYFIPYQEKSQ